MSNKIKILRLPPENQEGIKRVQVGCGPKNLMDNWWNVDIRDFNGIDEVMDVTKPWRWEGVLDYVYGEHFIEHLDLNDALHFLLYAGNSLRVGGCIRLSTPSLEWVLKTHFLFEEQDDDRIINQTLITNRAFHGWGHKFLYSKAMLGRLLNDIGYSNVSFHMYGKSDDPQLCGLECHGGLKIDGKFPSVWIVEGIRTSQKEMSIPKKLVDFIEDQYIRFVKGGH